MNIPPDFDAQAKATYGNWERSAPGILTVVAIVAAVSGYLYPPPVLVVGSCFLAGIGLFSCWRAALAGRTKWVPAIVVSSVVLSMAPLLFNVSLPLPVLFVQGCPWVFVGLFLCVLVARRRKGQ